MMFLKKNKILVFFYLLSFLIPLSVYFFTLAPTVTFGDSGELITAAYHLGISHPPGSPLWTLLAKLFIFLPFNSIAWRVNFSSAFFSALTASLFFAIQLQAIEMLQLKIRKFFVYAIALVTVLLFSFSRTVWTISVTAEIWSLNNVLFCLLLLSLLNWIKTKKNLFLYITSLIMGLSMTNHYFFLILVPILIIWVLYKNINLLINFKSIFIIIAFFLCGLSLYLYIPIRAQANPAINWGNPNTYTRFKNYVERKQFGIQLEADQEFQLGGLYLPVSSKGNVVSRSASSFRSYFLSLNQEFPFWVLVVSFSGMILCFFYAKKKKETLSWFLLSFLIFVTGGWGFAFLVNASVSNVNTYFTQYLLSFFILAMWFGISLAWIGEKLMIKMGAIAFLVVLFVCILLLVWQTYTNYQVCDWSKNRVAYLHGMNILDTADKNAIIIADKNNWIFPLLYLTKVEMIRPDVKLYDRTGNLFELVYTYDTSIVRSYDDLESQRRLVEQRIAKKNPEKPFYYAVDKNFENYNPEVNREGILYKDKRFSYKKIDFPSLYKNILSISNISWIDADSDYMLSYYHLRFGDQLMIEGRENEALSEYQKAYELARGYEVALNNVATTYIRLGKLDQGAKVLKEVLEINPKNDVALSNLASFYEIKGQIKQAIETYRELLKWNPSSLQSNLRLIDLLVKNGECEESDDIYITLNTERLYPQTINNIGVCFARQNNYSKAKEYWEDALEFDVNYQPAKDNLKKLESFENR